MSRRLLKELRDCLEGAVLTALTGFGLSLLLLTALFGQADMARVAAVCAVAALATCVLAVLPVRIIVPLLIAGIALSVLGVLNVGPLAGTMQPLRVFQLYPDLLSAARHRNGHLLRGGAA